MTRILAIATKDFRLTFRDRGALLTMLVTPLAIALILGFAFGGIGSGGGGSGGVTIAIVDQDGGQVGQAITAALTSPELSSLVTATVLTDPAAARARVDDNSALAAVIIPAGVTARAVATVPGPAATVEVVANPTFPLGAEVAQSVVDGVLARVASAAAAARLTAAGVSPLVAAGDPSIAKAAAAAAAAAIQGPGVALTVDSGAGGSGGGVSYGKIIGPSMAVMFLMFTVTAGGRRMLDERQAGTLARMLATPTRRGEILLGKACGIFFNGVAQVGILLAVSTAIFNITWGSTDALVLLTVALALAATGWGVLIAGLARSPAQVTQAGTAVSLVFGLAAGNLIPREQLPELMRNVSLATPNALGLEGYQRLAGGGGIESVAPYVLGLLGMAVVLLVVGTVASRGRLTAA